MHAFRVMRSHNTRETLAEKLLRSRRTLEMQLQQGRASCESQEALDRMSELEKKNDPASDAFIQRGEA